MFWIGQSQRQRLPDAHQPDFKGSNGKPAAPPSGPRAKEPRPPLLTKGRWRRLFSFGEQAYRSFFHHGRRQAANARSVQSPAGDTIFQLNFPPLNNIPKPTRKSRPPRRYFQLRTMPTPTSPPSSIPRCPAPKIRSSPPSLPAATLTSAAAVAGVHRNTIFYRRRESSRFRHALAHAHYERTLHHRASPNCWPPKRSKPSAIF